MKVISLTGKVKLTHTCAAIGIFDGVHRGHQYLIKKMLLKAKASNLKSLVITFFPHPAHVLRPDLPLQYLATLKQRLKLLEKMGVDYCVVVPFTKKFAHILPVAFIRDVLVKQLGVKALFVGDAFRFGHKRSGDVNLFKALAKKYDYQMFAVKALMQGGKPVSSTRIRALVAQGDLRGAKQLLGRTFHILGIVKKGKGRGKGLGFPTANVDYEQGVVPPVGVYAVQVIYQKKTYDAVANLGFNPSFKDKTAMPILEVYIFGFNKNIYGKELDVSFIKRIRDEKTFPSIGQLRVQIAQDVQKARRILS